MSLTITKKQIGKTFVQHVIIWMIWQSINSLSLIKDWNEIPKLPLLYNYLSLVILFYPVYYSARGYGQKVEYLHAQTLSVWGKFWYLFFRWRVLLILFFVLVYIVGSWFADRNIFNIIYDNFPLYCNGRWTRASTYVFVAIGYSYVKYIHAKYKRRLEIANTKMEAANIKIVILKEFIAKNQVDQHAALHELTRRVDEYTGRKTG